MNTMEMTEEQSKSYDKLLDAGYCFVEDYGHSVIMGTYDVAGDTINIVNLTEILPSGKIVDFNERTSKPRQKTAV